MSTWNIVIAKLASKEAGNPSEAEATVMAQREYSTVKKQFERSERNLRTLENAHAEAQQNLQALEAKALLIEQDTQQALAQQQDQKAQALAVQIAQLHVTLLASQQQVAQLDTSLVGLKGVLSHNRYNLFRLEQQLDTLNATVQLQQAQTQLAERKGIRTALDSIALMRARAASNDDASAAQTASILEAPIPETADAILKRLQKSLQA
jgi:predicted RNase H-like nuclease (RuvC/YqgF family)